MMLRHRLKGSSPAIVCVAAALAMAVSPAHAVTVAPNQGVSIYQVDFEWANASLLSSHTGKVAVDEMTLAAETGVSEGYINVLTSEGWVVQNMRVSASFAPRTVTTMFRLGTIGRKTSLAAQVDYSPTPLETFDGALASTFPVASCTFSAEGRGRPVTGTPVPPPVVPLDFDAGRLDVECCNDGVPNVQAANAQCGPAAAANSLDWMHTVYGVPIPHPNVPGLRPDSTLVGKIEGVPGMNRSVTSREVGDGVDDEQFIKGKLDYLASIGVTDLDIKFQASLDGDPPQTGNIQSSGLTARREGTDPTAEWIFEQICSGEDVELGYTNPTPPGGGHWVTVVCAGYDVNGPYIYHVSDQLQTDRDPTDTQGCDEVQFAYLVDTDVPPDGILNLDGEPNSPNVDIVVAESPGGSPVEDRSWGVIKAMYR